MRIAVEVGTNLQEMVMRPGSMSYGEIEKQ